MSLWEDFIAVLRDAWTKRSIGIIVPIEATGFNKYEVSEEGPDPVGVVIHHSFSKDGQARDWDGIRAYHKSFRYQGEIITEGQYEEYKRSGHTAGLERPWTDIGYHLGIEAVNGQLEIQKGRPIKSPGAHTLGLDAKGRSFNRYYIGVCLVGNFDTEPPDESRLFLLGSMCRDFQRMFGFARDHVLGHHETFTIRGVPVEKSCPGAMFDLGKFRERLI